MALKESLLIAVTAGRLLGYISNSLLCLQTEVFSLKIIYLVLLGYNKQRQQKL